VIVQHAVVVAPAYQDHWSWWRLRTRQQHPSADPAADDGDGREHGQ
jgi:hypothetical protein